MPQHRQSHRLQGQLRLSQEVLSQLPKPLNPPPPSSFSMRLSIKEQFTFQEVAEKIGMRRFPSGCRLPARPPQVQWAFSTHAGHTIVIGPLPDISGSLSPEIVPQ